MRRNTNLAEAIEATKDALADIAGYSPDEGVRDWAAVYYQRLDKPDGTAAEATAKAVTAPTRTGRRLVAVDFDGVLHSYMSPWTNAETISDDAGRHGVPQDTGGGPSLRRRCRVE